MEPLAAGVVGALLGVLVGLVAATLLARPHRGSSASAGTAAGPAGEGAGPTPLGAPSGRLPPGALEVLAALPSWSAVVDGSEEVVQASPATYAAGLVRENRLTSEPLRGHVRAVRRDGQVRESEMELRKGPLDGQRVVVRARVAPLGRELVLVLVEDRTEAHRVEAVRRDFVANVSHELKTPVGALALLAEAVLGASDDPRAISRFATRMQYEAGRLSNLVQELIDLSRLQGHDPLRQPQVVEVDEVVSEAVERSRLAAAGKSIRLVVGGERGLTVLGSENQLVTAVRNLVDNAISYSPEHTQVAISMRRAGEQEGTDIVEIMVTDQGVGIPERELDRIFERFYRIDQARSRATGGTGLGLSIVKHVAVNHGGEVRVWSVEGSGSTFTIRLPVDAARAPVPALPGRRKEASA